MERVKGTEKDGPGSGDSIGVMLEITSGGERTVREIPSEGPAVVELPRRRMETIIIERHSAEAIAARAVKLYKAQGIIRDQMDIAACHLNGCPLRLRISTVRTVS